MFQKVGDSDFISGEHQVLKFWEEQGIFDKLREKNRGKQRWSFLDGPITANNPMGVHHAWGRTYKDAFQRYFAMTGHDQRYQNGFDCQGLWVEVEVEKELKLGTKTAINEFGIDRFVNECKKRVLKFAARQTEQSIRLGYWTDWDDPATLRLLSETISSDDDVTITTPTGKTVTGKAHELTARLGNPEWGGSYFTFSTENNETIWTFLKKCFQRGKIYRGYDVMPWSGRAGSAYSQMEVADGRRLTVHKSCFVRFPLKSRESRVESREPEKEERPAANESSDEVVKRSQMQILESQMQTLERMNKNSQANAERRQKMFDALAGIPTTEESAIRNPQPAVDKEFLLVWTTTPWTLTSNVACAVNPDLDYVKLQTLRDNAIYYFAKDNLDYKRLDKEFKEGFGGPDWKWPKDVPKLKTIAQLFKEQGGYEVLGTLKGAEMVGWRYEGPFDELPAQQEPGGSELQPRMHIRGYASAAEKPHAPSAIDCHRVIDGGRDNKGNPNVVAGEGTGIVHIAPGCGDIDHKLGEEHGLVGIAPLGEDGTFGDGFGPFTGREAIAPDTAQLVFDTLKENHKLVYVEQYPHIYPHCWRTGDELVFRLVDEWFINMDWRDEIKEVVKTIRWIPDSIQGQERELEWLTNMRDWMISKKRFWGLALPIWVNPDDPADFEVIGSLAELKERAVAGWDDFAGHTPHRPWIDGVKIRSEKTGATLSRIVDVGNPWLDAGIVPFSTMPRGVESRESRVESQTGAERRETRDESEQSVEGKNSGSGLWTLDSRLSPWFPADFVTECFPGQFRNWFYSLLSLATMMRYDETDDPAEKRPFKNLLGHRLVMDERGNAMHKSDGTAIWFEEAAEQLGVDTLRWMYLAQNPAQDLRFGTRHPDQLVPLHTPEGTITETKEGLPTCRVTSTPADEVRRQILIPLWNSYAFFVNYARLDEFDPNLDPVPVAERPEIDRWILSNLQALIQKCRDGFENYDTPRACAAAAEFIDDLSNWYIRRNRRRFWRSRSEVGGRRSEVGTATQADDLSSGWDPDKLAAYQTLYEVLVTLTKVLAPVIPFLCERMYGNLVQGEPPSVHLCDYPEQKPSYLDERLNRRMAAAQVVVKLGHKLREQSNLRVRQPLGELRCLGRRLFEESIGSLNEVIRDELNVKQLTLVENLNDIVTYSYKANLKTLGPKYGKLLGELKKQIESAESLATMTFNVDGVDVTLSPEDVLVDTDVAADWVAADDRGIQIALSTKLTPELLAEGIRNDFVRHVQQARKDANLEIQDRICVFYHTAAAACGLAVQQWTDYIKAETLADEVAFSNEPPADVRPVTVGDAKAMIWITS